MFKRGRLEIGHVITKRVPETQSSHGRSRWSLQKSSVKAPLCHGQRRDCVGGRTGAASCRLRAEASCSSWFSFSFIPGWTNANPVWVSRPQRTHWALGTSLKRERAGNPVPWGWVGNQRRGCDLKGLTLPYCHHLVRGCTGPLRYCKALLFGSEEYSHC